MKFIPIGIQCAVPDAINKSKLREYSYPFDWLWCPSKTTYDILECLVNKGIESTIEFMTTGLSSFIYKGNERYISTNEPTECQMNKNTGLGFTHFTINDEYIMKLRRRLTRLYNDICSQHKIFFVYADSANTEHSYWLDDINYEFDATADLIHIYDLIHTINPNIEILYFCWDSRVGSDSKISYIPFSKIRNWHIRDWNGVSVLIQQYFENNKDKYFLS